MFVVGSYATSPNLWALENGGEINHTAEADFYAKLRTINMIDGLEVQLNPAGSMHSFDEQIFLDEYVSPHWCAVITCIGGTMGNITKNPRFGLASDDTRGRLDAIEFAKEALAAVTRWNSRGKGCGKVLAVQLHSAPNQMKGSSSSASLRKSLETLMEWDWQGARLIIEHCDAPGETVSKGFLPLSHEIGAVYEANMIESLVVSLTPSLWHLSLTCLIM